MKWLLLWVVAAFSAGAHAHKFSDSYLQLDTQSEPMSLRWDIALRDLDLALGLDSDQDGKLTWGEVRRQSERIAAYALSRLTLRREDGACDYATPTLLIDRHSDGAYAVLRTQAQCGSATGPLSVDYRLLFDLDPQHRGILSTHGGGNALLFSPDHSSQQIADGPGAPALSIGTYFVDGIWHILTGYDHLLFLMTLLVPAVLVRKDRIWRAAGTFGGAAKAIVQVVTAFTVAHSITLSLATLQIVSLPSRWVESAIAASVVLAAINNIWPVIVDRRWVAAFAFGLIHGFGFAAVLNEAHLSAATLAWSLAAFNLGVEAGQLAVVALLMPVAYALRHTQVYRRRFVPIASALAAVMGSVWLWQRMIGS